MYGNYDREQEAKQWINDHADPTDAPPAWVVKELLSLGLPYEGRNYRVKDADWTHGDPQHGAKRSDDHVSLWEVVGPLSKMERDIDGGIPDACPECGGTTGLYRERSHHHIAGSEAAFCVKCEAKVWGRDWG